MRVFAHIGHSRSLMPARPPGISLKPRKTPGQRRSAATVAAIVEAAARILEVKGFEAYNTNAVAERAGVSIGSLYQYFPNRDAITRALIERETAALLEDVAAVEAEVDGRAAIRQMLAAAVRHQLRRPALGQLLDLEESRLPIGEDIRRTGNHIARVLRHCLAGAGLAGGTGEPVAEDLMAIVKGMVDAAGQRGETDPDSLLIRVERAAFGYLERCSPRRSNQ
jgi:AcrR family transcriptional regulator